MRRYRAGHEHEGVSREQCVAECLLASARSPRPQPVGIGDVLRLNDVNFGRIEYLCCGEHMRDGVECVESPVNRNLQNGGGRIERRIDGADAAAVPTAAGTESA